MSKNNKILQKTSNQRTKLENSKFKSCLCDYSDTYTLVKKPSTSSSTSCSTNNDNNNNNSYLLQYMIKRD